MMRYAPQTVGVLRTILDGLDPDMPVELERGVPLVAATVADLRALDAWPPLPSAWTARAPGGTTSSSSGCSQIRGGVSASLRQRQRGLLFDWPLPRLL
jgi:hypothetical protein